MDIQKAIDTLNHLVFCGSCTTGPCKDCDRKNAKDTAIQGLKELQQYRQIGTVDECRATRDELIELQEYRKLGTVKECWEARGKQIPQKPERIEVNSQGCDGDGIRTSKESYHGFAYKCPKCGCFLRFKTDCCGEDEPTVTFCSFCGQALKWGD